MNLLVFGKNGQVGTELQRALQPLGNLVLAERSDADFSSPNALRALLANRAPDALLNAVAYTTVDLAADELARTINVNAVRVLAEFARERCIWLVHYSTDYVFDGASSLPFTEIIAPTP